MSDPEFIRALERRDLRKFSQVLAGIERVRVSLQEEWRELSTELNGGRPTRFSTETRDILLGILRRNLSSVDFDEDGITLCDGFWELVTLEDLVPDWVTRLDAEELGDLAERIMEGHAEQRMVWN